jgi:RHS repeat-associated protein
MSLAESGTETAYLFTGKELDYGTGLSYSINRYLDQRIGRWLVPDPARQYWSPYVYCGNNPVKYKDPDGNFAYVLPAIPGLIVAGKALFYTSSVILGIEVGKRIHQKNKSSENTDSDF